MIVFQVLYVFSSIGIFSIAMQCCWRKVSASQFTLYMTIANLGRITGAKIIGPVKAHFSWEYTLLLFPVMIVLAWGCTQLFRIKHHVKKLSDLENKDFAGQLPAMA